MGVGHATWRVSRLEPIRRCIPSTGELREGSLQTALYIFIGGRYRTLSGIIFPPSIQRVNYDSGQKIIQKLYFSWDARRRKWPVSRCGMFTCEAAEFPRASPPPSRKVEIRSSLHYKPPTSLTKKYFFSESFASNWISCKVDINFHFLLWRAPQR